MFVPVKKYRFAFMLYGLLLLTGVILSASVPKTELHLMMNGNHTGFGDTFFKIITLLGDGWFAIGLTGVCLLYRLRYSFMLLLSYGISGILIQILKRTAFNGTLRPASYLDQMPGLELVDGVHLHQYLSFPSGHTTAAFAVLLLAGMILKSRSAVMAGLILACFVALSRVYLSQHFLVDVLAGSVIGTFSALFFYWYFQKFKSSWIDLPLTAVFRKDRQA